MFVFAQFILLFFLVIIHPLASEAAGAVEYPLLPELLSLPSGTSDQTSDSSQVPQSAEQPPWLGPALGPEEPAEPGGQTLVPEENRQLPPMLVPEVTPVSPPAGQDLFDVLYGGISKGFLTTAIWLDSFFGDERYDAETNKSRLRVSYEGFREDGTAMDFRPQVNLRLVLPQLQRKTHLLITGDPYEDIETTSARTGVPTSTPVPKTEDRNVTTSLAYFFRSTERRSISMRGGIQLHQGKPVLFLGPRYRLLYHFLPWDFRIIEEVLWFTDTGWLSRTRFDLERPLPRDFFLRFSAEGVWKEDVNGYPYSVSALVRQPLDSKRALEYVWVNSFQTRPAYELDEVLFLFRYRQRIWRDWLFWEVAPQVRYPRDRSFDATPGVLFKLEMVFGDFRDYF